MIIILFGLGLASVAYSYKWYSHWRELKNIDQAYQKALLQNTYCDDFLFSAWKVNDWTTAQDVLSKKEEVKKVLKHPDLKKDLLLKIQKEKKQLERWICYAGSFTNLPEEFIKKIKESKPNIILPNLWFDSNHYAHQALVAAPHLKAIQIDLDETKDQNKLLKNCKSSWYNKLFFASQWNPLSWSVAPCKTKATKLWMKLIRSYARLSALEEIAQEITSKSSKDEERKATAKITGTVYKVN